MHCFPTLRRTRLQGFIGLIAIFLCCGMATTADARPHHGHHRHRAAAAAPAVSRYAAIIVDADTGRVLSSTNPDRRCYPASLTKMMTLYLLFDALDQGKLRLDSQLTASAHAAAQAPSKLALEPGDHIRVEEAILALVTKSANDVAVVLAEAMGDTEANFAQMMTEKAHALGMRETTYRNASGLPNLGQVSTPRDQAILAHALIRNHARYYHFFSTRDFTWQGSTIPSHNRFMLNYEGADGLKTGYINASGFNLVASAVRNGHRLIGAVFGGNSGAWRDQRMMQLMDNGFAHLSGAGTEMAADDNTGEPDPIVQAKAIEVADASPSITAPTNADRSAKSRHHPARKPKVAVQEQEQDQGDDSDSPWAIQVGAFSKFSPAHHAATNAAKHLGGLLAKASIDIDEAGRRRHPLYRARLIGFTEEQARAACHKLARSKRECHIIQPSG